MEIRKFNLNLEGINSRAKEIDFTFLDEGWLIECSIKEEVITDKSGMKNEDNIIQELLKDDFIYGYPNNINTLLSSLWEDAEVCTKKIENVQEKFDKLSMVIKYSIENLKDIQS